MKKQELLPLQRTASITAHLLFYQSHLVAYVKVITNLVVRQLCFAGQLQQVTMVDPHAFPYRSGLYVHRQRGSKMGIEGAGKVRTGRG
jgi:hypothetical protein